MPLYSIKHSMIYNCNNQENTAYTEDDGLIPVSRVSVHTHIVAIFQYQIPMGLLQACYTPPLLS